jgi:alpha-L-glutamate ligase-like protein
MFAWMRRYEELGILGMNARNSDFILKYNPRKYYPLVDDKILTAALATKEGIATPEIYEVVESPSQTLDFAERMKMYDEFVVKPAAGSGGGGIIVISGRNEESFIRASGREMNFADMRYHLTNTLSGMYSLGGQTDRAIVQYRVHPDAFFASMTTGGVPDVRVIVFQGVPIMAMLRLPTRESDGKANLHAGGIGVGVKVATGETSFGVYRGNTVSTHPDTSASISGRVIPYWDDILKMSSRFYEITGLGYLGVDIVIDRSKGPMMLEVNARPGIAIQVANRKGLKSRLLRVEKEIGRLATTDDKISFAKEVF